MACHLTRCFNVVISVTVWFDLILILNNILLYECTTFYLSSQWLMDICVVSTFWPLGIKPLWTFMNKFLCKHVVSYLQYIPKTVLLGHVITLCSRTRWTIFRSSCVILHSNQQFIDITFSLRNVHFWHFYSTLY